jgi:hypothetical protein
MSLIEKSKIIPIWKLWMASLGGAIAWWIHFLGAYVLAEFGCISKTSLFTFLGVMGISWFILTLSIFCLFLSGLAIWISHKNQADTLKAVTEGGETSAHLQNSQTFIFRGGVFINLLFFFVIIVQTIPVFYYLRSC